MADSTPAKSPGIRYLPKLPRELTTPVSLNFLSWTEWSNVERRPIAKPIVRGTAGFECRSALELYTIPPFVNTLVLKDCWKPNHAGRSSDMLVLRLRMNLELLRPRPSTFLTLMSTKCTGCCLKSCINFQQPRRGMYKWRSVIPIGRMNDLRRDSYILDVPLWFSFFPGSN